MPFFPTVWKLSTEYFAVRVNSQSSWLVQQSAKFIAKQLLQNKQMRGFSSYASFHFSYSTKLFCILCEVY